ncbi:MAG: hypothetical protein Q7R68_10785 [Nitrospirales bacterium]|nr:hypothetical protein [Nitrospirales bacterium]
MATRRTTKTTQALAIFDAHPEWSPFRCAQEIGLSPSALYKAIREREAALDGLCPTCRQPIRKETPHVD